MFRRDFLKLGLGAACGLTPDILHARTNDPIFSGWVDDAKARHRWVKGQTTPYLTQQNQQIRGTGKGKTVLLWKYLEEVTQRPLLPHLQDTGDCVSHAFGLGIDILTAVQILKGRKPERWIGKTATEIIYAGSRFEAGGGVIKYRAGSTGAWAADFVSRWGVLHRRTYLGGRYDYTTYSGSVADDLGRTGVPDALEPLCKLHPVKTVSLCRSWDECRDAVANGNLVAMCSNVGFRVRGGRDRDGFLIPGRRPWYHAMLIAGIDDSYKRPGALVINSWGSHWTYGPKRHEQPDGSFWVDASVINRALRQGDSIAMSSFVGYPRMNLSYYF